MRALIQRVTQAQVRVDNSVVGEISEPGLLILLGVTHDDTSAQVTKLATKVANLRILRNPQDLEARAEESLLSISAPALVVSQFTLYGSVAKGRRPAWTEAAPGEIAQPLYEEFCDALEDLGVRVERGVFGADMAVSLVNDGPFTLLAEV